MRRWIALLPLVALSACTNANNESIEIPFALLSSDELQVPTPGQPCVYTPVIQAGGYYRTGGIVDIDPNVNANPQYLLALQVENYLDQTVLTDSNGNPLSGPQRNDFHVQDVIVEYIPTDSSALSGMPGGDFRGCPTPGVPCGKFLATADVPAGGMQTATGVVVDTLSKDVISTIGNNIPTGGSTQIILQITMEGVLGSGEKIQTGTFDFPLTVGWDIDQNPLACPAGTTPEPDTHGPCCANQDFGDTCVACGGAGEPCCALPFGAQGADGGTANAPTPCQGTLTCQIQATLPIGVEACLFYPNDNSLLTVCAKPTG